MNRYIYEVEFYETHKIYKEVMVRANTEEEGIEAVKLRDYGILEGSTYDEIVESKITLINHLDSDIHE